MNVKLPLWECGGGGADATIGWVTAPHDPSGSLPFLSSISSCVPQVIVLRSTLSASILLLFVFPTTDRFPLNSSEKITKNKSCLKSLRI